ncbi:MAG: hypothetical protein RIS64_599 [Bacteroidota bacterium]
MLYFVSKCCFTLKLELIQFIRVLTYNNTVIQGSETIVHLKHLTAGMYIVRGQDAAGKFFTTKIVKE